MRTILVGVLIFVLSDFFNSCKPKNREPKTSVIGQLVVDLDANELVVRKRESLIGNMIADAIRNDYEAKNKAVNLALVNSGSIRFSSSTRTDGIYKAGDFTAGMADEMLPFGGTYVIVTVTGKQLKEILERSVAKYPLAKGNFMQLSKEVKIVVDTTQAAQVLNIDETEIMTQGSRVVSIKINNVEYDNLTLYKVAVPDFTAEGNDGYTTLRKISNSLKEYTGEDMASILKEYVIIKSVIEPKLEERITFQ
ncbi:MAG: 5-Nucleotidase protein [Bacteroidetes bacterium]|jgi:2',3'-cyclic-nucleotide 2'-phosphodiesterase (5'-nucleotidase family)|nr:5-Nucleotidase protein [Bacteroidota bacterium]